jgi:hypothetical protein
MIVAFLLTTVLLALSMGLVILTNVESAVSGNFRRSVEVLQAADAGVELAIGRLPIADWGGILAGDEPPCTTPDGAPVAPTGFYPTDRWGPNSPVWRLYLCLQRPAPAFSQTIAIWLADDASESDDDPFLDTNGRVTVRAEAFGAAGSHAATEASVAQAPLGLSILSWRALR